MPFVRLELAVLSIRDNGLQVLLGKRVESPHAGRWALPGGVVRIDLDLDLMTGCQRVAKERIGTKVPNLTQVGAVGGRWRDPRAPWALSVVYRSLIQARPLDVSPGKRLDELAWVGVGQVADLKLAFDHAELVVRAVEATRAEFQALRFPRGCLPDQFTLAELQQTSEAVLGRPLDKSSFRRRVDEAGCLQRVEGAMRTGPFRPAQLFELRDTQT